MNKVLAGLGKIAFAVERSGNTKLSGVNKNGNPRKLVSTTWAAQSASCPLDCAFLNNGCYAQSGYHTGLITARLNSTNPDATPLMAAQSEADSIDAVLTGKYPLRLHTVGDSITNAGTKVLAAAVHRFMIRGKAFTKDGREQIAWTYTHGYMSVLKEMWGKISVLASCETMKQVKIAHKRGYAAAMVVQHHPDNGKAYKEDGFTMIPCPQQTGKAASCLDCKLCWNADALHERKAVILFAAHGTGVTKANNALDRIQALFDEAELDLVAA